METGRPTLFWNLPSFFIIVGGTVATLITVFPPSKLKYFFPALKSAFKKKKMDVRKDIEIIVEMSKEARSKGILALEGMIDNYPAEEFLREGILLIVEGASEEDLRKHMEGIMHFTKKRRNRDAAMVGLVANTAPALGLVGTYIGLIPMLSNLDDPTSLGPMMAIELVSSFYGGVIANILFAPISRRLKEMAEEESSRNELILEGLVSIRQGKNPKMIESELMAYANLDSEKKSQKINIKQKKKTKVA